MAVEVLKLSCSLSKIIHMPLPQDDPKQRTPDITRAQKVLGGEPKLAFVEGLDRTIHYFTRLA